ncbi:MAG: tetratricopeptide repeat protein [Luteimonas sp.]
MNTFLLELRRRNVIRVAGLYLASAWLLVQVAATVLPMFSAPPWVARGLIIVLLIGFVPALMFNWIFQWTPDGLMREADVGSAHSIAPQSGKRMDRLIMVMLTLAVAYFAVDKFLLSPVRESTRMESARQEGRSEAIVQAHGERSIAVLPFVDMSQGKDQEYFSDGISEELLNLLAKIPALRVISRSSAFSYKGKEVDIPTVAKELNVAHILEGSVRKSGNKVRITAQLIDGRSDTHLWSETYDRPMDDIFAIQDEIAAAVVEQLKLKLLGKAPKQRETDPKAYTLYLQALAISRREEAESYEESIGLLKEALGIDPAFVAALNLLTNIYSAQAALGLIPAEQGFRLARETANKTIALDPGDGYAHALLALISFVHDGDTAAAARQMQRALSLDPDSLNILGGAEDIAKSLGHVDEAVALNEYMVARDPMLSNAYSQLGLAYVQAGRLDEAIAACRTALAMEPEQIITHYTIGTALLRKGNAQAALTEFGQEPFEAFRLFGQAMAYHTLGDGKKSDAVLAEIIAKYEKDAAFNIAYVQAWRGEADSAFTWLGKAVDFNDSGLPMVAIEPMFAKLHRDPRWLQFLRSRGKAPEQLAAIKFKVTLPDVTETQRAAPVKR